MGGRPSFSASSSLRFPGTFYGSSGRCQGFATPRKKRAPLTPPRPSNKILRARKRREGVANGNRAGRLYCRPSSIPDPVCISLLRGKNGLDNGVHLMAMQNLHREAALVRQLRSAMERLDDSSYGICLHCEELISPKRLKAIPWTEFCISCQETADHSNSKREFNTSARELPEAA